VSKNIGGIEYVDTTKFFGIRYTPFMRWDSGTGLMVADSNNVSPACADKLYVWNATGEMYVLPVLGPYDDVEPGLLVFCPDADVVTFMQTGVVYGAIPAFCTSPMTLCVSVFGDDDPSCSLSSLDAEYIPIADVQHAPTEFVLFADEYTG
jgi:hypothetical protein